MNIKNVNHFRYFITLLAIISSLEFMIMYVFEFFPKLNPMTEAILDASTLTLFSALPIWFLVIRPIFQEFEKKANLFQQAEDSFGLVAYFDGTGNFKEVNANFLTVSGYSKEDLIGQHYSKLNSGFHSEEFYQNVFATMSIGQIWQGNVCNKNKNGNYYWVKVVLIPVLDSDGKLVEFFSVQHDITNQYVALEELDKEKTRMELALKKLEFSIFEYNFESKKLVFDNSIWSLLESDETLYNGNFIYFKKFLFEDDFERIKEKLEQISEENTDLSFTIPIKTGSSQRRTVRIESKIEFEENRPSKLIGVIWDVSKEKDSEKKLIEASRLSSLGQMASGVAHEINNPLAIISGKTQVSIRQLKKIEGTQDIQKSLEVIYSTTNRIAKIVKGLLIFSNEKVTHEIEKINSENFFDQVLNLCLGKLNVYQIELRLKKPESSFEFEAYKNELIEVLLNLIYNSCEAIQNQDGRWIELEIMKKSDDRLRISVMDSGVGISEQIQDKIMLPFFTTKQEDKSVGLGLSTSESIIRAHHGRLYLDKKSLNTKFIIEIPMTQNQLTTANKNAKLAG